MQISSSFPYEQGPPNYGAFGSEQATLNWLIGRLVSELNPLSIYLFGSRARGTARPDSDFDLLVVTNDEDEESSDEYARVYAPLLGSGIGCDVVPISLSDFLECRDEPTSMAYEIFRNGKIVYERK
jgi:predicted nucleotidyltransferase